MNISITRIFLLIVGAILILAGVRFLIDSIPAKDWIEGLFALVALAAGFALIVGKGINISE